MPATINRNIVRGLSNSGNFHHLIFQYTGPAVYATGGEAIAANDLKLGKLELIQDFTASDGTNVIVHRYNHTTGKLLAYYVDNNGVSDSGLIEIPNATNLSTFIGRTMAWGTA